MRFHSQENTFANQIKFTKILREIRYYCYLFMGYIHTLRLLGIGREHKSSFWFVLQLQCYVKNCKSYLLQGNSKINQVVSSLQTATHALFCRPHREKRTMHCTHRNLKESAACAAFIALFRTYKVVWLSVRLSCQHFCKMTDTFRLYFPFTFSPSAKCTSHSITMARVGRKTTKTATMEKPFQLYQCDWS